jgi:hypothetical protein
VRHGACGGCGAQQVVNVQPAVTTTVTEAAAVNPALTGVGATLFHAFYHPSSTAATTATTYPATTTTTTTTAPLNVAHQYLPAHPTVGMFTTAAPAYTEGAVYTGAGQTTYAGTAQASGYANNYAAAPVVSSGYTNNYVVGHTGTSYANNYQLPAQTTYAPGPTLYGTDPGVHATAPRGS